MKSFIGWIGGKKKQKKHIIPLIPAACDRYIEVCGGAGWVLFGKQQQKGQMEVFNDIDSDLVNCSILIDKSFIIISLCLIYSEQPVTCI